MKFRPLADKILVKRIEKEEKTSGGIFIPPSAQEKPQYGEIVAVGSGKRLDSGEIIAPDVKPGDMILFGKYAGSEFKIDGVEHMILREDEILGIVEE